MGNGNVLKIAKLRSKNGISSNKREVKAYNFSPSQVKKHLAAIRDYDNKYLWLIMKRYLLHFPKSKKYNQKLHKVRTKFKKNGIIPHEVVSRRGAPNFQNLRLKNNGEIVVIDYGNFRLRR